MMKNFFIGLLIISFLVGTMGCAGWNRTAKGAAIGAGAGGAAGGLIGYATGNTAAGVLIGAAVGGAAGALIGNYMDKQAAEIERDIEGAKVERVGEGIKITFNSGILFDVNKTNLKDYSRTELTKLAAILSKYDDTNIRIITSLIESFDKLFTGCSTKCVINIRAVDRNPRCPISFFV